MGPSGTENSQTNLANQESGYGQEFQATAFPGFQAAENYYQRLASGNPNLVNQAVAPQVNQINQQYEGRVQAAKKDLSRGGAQGDLTGQLENQQAGQIANLKTGAVASAIPALANLGVQGGNLSATDMWNAIGALGNVGQEQAQGKASTLGAIGSLGGSWLTAGTPGAGAIGSAVGKL